MGSKCYYCQTEGDFQAFENPENGKTRPTCGQCRSQLVADRRKVQIVAHFRFFGIPLLTLIAIILLLFGEWRTSLISSIMAAVIASIDSATV